MAGYYDQSKDYSLAIVEAQNRGASDAEISQLRQERQNKIDAQYGGNDPYKGKNDIMGNLGSSSGGSSSNRTNTTSTSGNRSNSSTSSNRVNSGGSSSGPGQASQSASSAPALNQYGYRDGYDYSTALSDPNLSAAERRQLTQERENKITYQYGGTEPNMTGTNQKFSDTPMGQLGRGSGTAFDNNFAQNTFTAGVNYADEAAKHAAQGDWGAVERDLIQRQAKIDAQGGNNRGLTNQQLLQQLQQQYGTSYGQLSQRDQDRMTLISGGKLPFTGAYGQQGYITAGTGWSQGVDYLAQAQQYAQQGDLDAAYDALMRRGFKMYDTGSAGGGVSQDQAYAMIDRIWRSSPQAQQAYQSEMERNAQWIAESGAKAGNPSNAYKTLRKGNYWITYDGNGTPVIAGRVSSKVGNESKHTTYTPEQIDYLAKYYAGQAGDYSQAYIPAHNIMVTQTGVGRLVDNYGNYASGEAPLSTNAKGYTGSLFASGANTNQDRAALMSVQQRIDAGEQFGSLGPSTGVNGSVPIATTKPLPGSSINDLDWSLIGGGNNGTGGSVGSGTGVADAYNPGSMNDYLDRWYQDAQEQQKNTIDFGTSQGVNELIRAQQDANAQFQTQLNQIAIDEAKAKDNQALYAAARGDRGGIGAAQYDSIMNTAAQNRLSVNSAQTKLATDTARQIADLRAQGEYEKADALLQLSQQYLSQLMSLEQWSMDYNLSVAQFNSSLQQWEKEYDLKVADLLGSYNGTPTLSAQQFAFNQQQYQDELTASQDQKLASAGETLMAAGIMPSASQLKAMGMTQNDAQNYITALKVQQASKASKSSGSGGSSKTGASDIDGLFEAALDQDHPWSWIKENYKKYGLSGQPDKSEFEAYQKENAYSEEDVSSVAKAWYTDLYKYYGSQEDRLNAIYKEYNNGDSWMTDADLMYLLDKLGLR